MEQRKHERTDFEAEIKLDWLGQGLEVTTIINYSEGGLLLRNPFADIPPVDTAITVQVITHDAGNKAPVLSARVVRADNDQIACVFIMDTD